MTRCQYDKACYLRKRILELDVMIKDLEDNSSEISLETTSIHRGYKISPDMKNVLLAMARADKIQLEKEFEEL